MNNVISFTETTNNLVLGINKSLETLVAINKSLTTQEDTVQLSIMEVNPFTGDPSLVNYSLPSYNKVLSKLGTLTNSMETFIKGEGKVLLNDGSYREVKVIPIAISPEKITNVTPPTKFKTRSNWFFESMMFPQLIVSFDLKNKIDDRSDRVVVKRVILDNTLDSDTTWFKLNIQNAIKPFTYYDLINYYNINGKNYWEDEEIQELPLYVEPYNGYFLITNKQTIDFKEWFFIDSLNYGATLDSPTIKNIQLNVGNYLRYNNSTWKIDNINVSEKRILLTPVVGLDYPTIGNRFEIYNPPFSSKILNIPVGYNECESIFIKGINDDYNIISDEWSDSISFFSNELTVEGQTPSITLDTYYNNFVSDFGIQLEGMAREKYIPAYLGVIPDAPVFTSSNFSVSQINTQLNASLDVNVVKTTQTQIETTKTIVNSLKNTISQQKKELVELRDSTARQSLQEKINVNINDLSKRTVEYQSLVRSLSTLAYENSAVLTSPKYRIRGFFEIPSGKTQANDSTSKIQEIIQFEIAYRYLKLDNTGTSLNTYTHTDASTGQTVTGVFTDWTIVSTPIKQKTYDAASNTYSWSEPSVSDGTITNINQLDIPIQRGEKVQIKIKSVSEAGWPLNPVKSDWSKEIIVDFPANLSSNDQLTNILTDAITEENSIKLTETLAASGMTSHISDSVPNPSAADGVYFKHQANFIAVNKKGINSEYTTDLQSYIEKLGDNTLVTISNAGVTYTAPLNIVVSEILAKIPGFDFSVFSMYTI